MGLKFNKYRQYNIFACLNQRVHVENCFFFPGRRTSFRKPLCMITRHFRGKNSSFVSCFEDAGAFLFCSCLKKAEWTSGQDETYLALWLLAWKALHSACQNNGLDTIYVFYLDAKWCCILKEEGIWRGTRVQLRPMMGRCPMVWSACPPPPPPFSFCSSQLHDVIPCFLY